jgi:hypothetical protein
VTASLGLVAMPSASGGGNGVPSGECPRPQESLMPSAQTISPSGEQVVDAGVDGQKAPGVRPRFETPHLPCALASELV